MRPIIFLLLLLGGSLTLVAQDRLPKRDGATLIQRVVPAYRAGQPFLVIKELSPLYNRWGLEDEAEANHLLDSMSLPMAKDLLIECRIELARTDQRAPRAPLKETLAVVEELRRRIAARKDKRSGHPALQTPYMAPTDFVTYRRYLQDLHYLQLQLREAAQHAALLVDMVKPLTGRTAQSRLSDEQQKLVAQDFAAERRQLSQWADALSERMVELRVERLIDAEAVTRLSQDTNERLLAAYAFGVDGPRLLRQLESGKFSSPLLSDPALPARLQTLMDLSQQHLGDAAEKARLLEEAIEWWLRGRYGVGPRGNGLMKFANPNSQLALFMPVAPLSMATESDSQTPPTWEPQYDRRHQYIWLGENRDIQYAVGSATGATDRQVDTISVTQRQVVM